MKGFTCHCRQEVIHFNIPLEFVLLLLVVFKQQKTSGDKNGREINEAEVQSVSLNSSD